MLDAQHYAQPAGISRHLFSPELIEVSSVYNIFLFYVIGTLEDEILIWFLMFVLVTFVGFFRDEHKERSK